MIVEADRAALGEARWIFTNSDNVRRRLERSVGLTGEVLYHRSPLAQKLLGVEPGPYGDYVLFPSRFDRLKRQNLAVESMSHTETGVRLLLVGAGPEEAAIRRQIEDLGVGDRVEVRVNVPEPELIELYLGALAVYYGPYDEDYGLVTVEGMGAARPVITTKDSGGPLEIVDDGFTGLVVEPEPLAIAGAFDRLAADTELARRLGEESRRFVHGAVPDWPTVARRILGR
jgi:glycosyltransferase involved in cell wall biosynthesis